MPPSKAALITAIKKMPFALEALHYYRRHIHLLTHNAVLIHIENRINEAKSNTIKRQYKTKIKHNLDKFLAQGNKLDFPKAEHSAVDIILVLFNQAAMTLACLQSLSKSNAPCRIIIVDNNSSDETAQLLKQVSGTIIITSKDNLGFLKAVNLAAKKATSRHILLLNNDTTVKHDTISTALATIESAPDIGAVGGKLILPNGRLQEAGSIIWQNGSCLGYGRGDDPNKGEYNFRREVDYCSGAFLLIRRNILEQLDGFDEAFCPAYYEESDLCVRIRQQGYKVIYEPAAEVNHYEFASSKSSNKAIALQKRNKTIFTKKHPNFLKQKILYSPANIIAARTSAKPKGRVLIIDDRVPFQHLGGGFPRALDIINEIHAIGYEITLYPLRFPDEQWKDVYNSLPREVEVMLQHGMGDLKNFLKQRQGHYQHVIISRPRNMTELNIIYQQAPELFANTKIIYDAEALFSLREIKRRQIIGQPFSPQEELQLIDQELQLSKIADKIISVSEAEAESYQANGSTVEVLGHSITANPGTKSFADRKNILFIGSLTDENSPNTDSMLWFAEEIMPQIRKQLGDKVKLLVIGNNTAKKLQELESDNITFLGKISEIEDYYNQCRIFIAPTRFAAGIPHKIHQAAALGIPVVCTSLLVGQLGWKDKREILSADSATEFANQCCKLYTDEILWRSIRAKALKRIEEDCSKEKFTQVIKKIL